MPKFTVVLWEQRRIEMTISANNQSEAEDKARDTWHYIGDNDLNTETIDEVTFVDNREIKAVIIEEEKA